MGYLKDLSMYGWISVIVCGIICVILNVQTVNQPWLSVSNSYHNSDDKIDDDHQGKDDKCYESFYPKKEWEIYLSEGLCFSDMPSSFDQSGLAVTNYTGTLKSDGSGLYCYAWNSKYELDSGSSKSFWGDNGIVAEYCESLKKTYDKDDDHFNADTENILDCKNWGKQAEKYEAAGLLGKSGIGFASIAIALGAVGALNSFKKEPSRIRETAQGIAGVSLTLCFIMSMVQIIICKASQNPFTQLANNMALGCFPGWLKGYTFTYVSLTIGSANVVAYANMIISFVMGSICLTSKSCYNKCCCPCCFNLADSDQKFTVTGYVTSNMNSYAVSESPYQSYNDQAGGVKGVAI